MISAIAFDFGGVLSRGGGVGTFDAKWADVLGIPVERLNEIAAERRALINGTIDEAGFIQAGIHHFGLDPTINYLKRWAKHDAKYLELEPAYFKLAAELRQRGLITGVISNIASGSVPSIRAAGGYKDFDPVVLSCEVGASKPNAGIYARFCQLSGCAADECVLIDDQGYGRRGAVAFGFAAAIEAKNPAYVREQLFKLL